MKQIKKYFQALGTINSIMVSYEEEKEDKVVHVLENIKMKVMDMDNRLSVFKETSEISQINAAAGKGLIQVSQDTHHIIRKAVDYSIKTEGAFDITVRPLTKLWGIGKKGDFVPSRNQIEEAMELVNYKDIIIIENPGRVGLREYGQAIDLGSIAKGYAADEARNVLMENSMFDAIINFGGTIIVLGSEKNIGIQNPFSRTGTPFGVVKVKDKAIVTSGCYERYFMKDGKRYHHIIDPRTGMPADTGISSISVIGNSAIELDALSTAVYVNGMDRGIKLLEKCNLEGIFISSDQEVFITGNLKEHFAMKD